MTECNRTQVFEEPNGCILFSDYRLQFHKGNQLLPQKSNRIGAIAVDQTNKSKILFTRAGQLLSIHLNGSSSQSEDVVAKYEQGNHDFRSFIQLKLGIQYVIYIVDFPQHSILKLIRNSKPLALIKFIGRNGEAETVDGSAQSRSSKLNYPSELVLHSKGATHTAFLIQQGDFTLRKINFTYITPSYISTIKTFTRQPLSLQVDVSTNKRIFIGFHKQLISYFFERGLQANFTEVSVLKEISQLFLWTPAMLLLVDSGRNQNPTTNIHALNIPGPRTLSGVCMSDTPIVCSLTAPTAWLKHGDDSLIIASADGVHLYTTNGKI